MYSMFPSGRAGVALLVLRLSLVLAIFLTWTTLPGRYAWASGIAVLLGLLLCAGLATFASAVVCVVGLVILAASSAGTAIACFGLTAGVAITAALLGPGAYSVDARLFGRRRMLFDRTKEK